MRAIDNSCRLRKKYQLTAIVEISFLHGFRPANKEVKFYAILTPAMSVHAPIKIFNFLFIFLISWSAIAENLTETPSSVEVDIFCTQKKAAIDYVRYIKYFNNYLWLDLPPPPKMIEVYDYTDGSGRIHQRVRMTEEYIEFLKNKKCFRHKVRGFTHASELIPVGEFEIESDQPIPWKVQIFSAKLDLGSTQGEGYIFSPPCPLAQNCSLGFKPSE